MKNDYLFTIGFVNYKSSVFMETQFKIYEKFAGEKFKIVIIENTNTEKEFDTLNKIINKFSIPIELIKYSIEQQKNNRSTHGDCLQYLLDNYVDTEYFLTQDPDFFWVKPRFLTYFREIMEEGNVAAGSIYYNYDYYNEALGENRGFFPAAFGAVYKTNEIKNKNCNFYMGVTSGEEAKNPKDFRDVGWKIRQELANKKYSYLEAEKIDLKIGEISPFPQESHLGYTIKYVDKKTKEAIGYHLRKGSFLFKHEDPKTYIPEIETPEDWQNNKKKACKIFWNEIKKAKIKWQ